MTNSRRSTFAQVPSLKWHVIYTWCLCTSSQTNEPFTRPLYVNVTFQVDMAGLRYQVPAILFYRLLLHFICLPPLPPFVIGWANRSRKRLYRATKFERTLNPLCRRQCKILSPTFVLPFPPFPGGVDNAYIVSFIENLSTNSRIMCGFRSRHTSSIKHLLHEWRLPNNLVSIFQVENVSSGKL